MSLLLQAKKSEHQSVGKLGGEHPDRGIAREIRAFHRQYSKLECQNSKIESEETLSIFQNGQTNSDTRDASEAGSGEFAKTIMCFSFRL